MRRESKVLHQIKESCPPPIRWAGGKRLLVSRLLEFLPEKFETYYEPMVGSGALFFALFPERAVLADINKELVNFYRILRSQPIRLHAAVHRCSPDKATYYGIRSQNPTSSLSRAVRFLFLIRLSWNGLYRVNKEGRFNVPYGGRSPDQMMSLERAMQASKPLRKAKLLSGDFEATMLGIDSGDFAYFDPPYPKGASDGNGFARYSEMGFPLDEHKRLARFATRLAERGVHVMITEAARKEILKYYPPDFHFTFVRNPSLIAAESRFRRDAFEAIITSYPVKRERSAPVKVEVRAFGITPLMR